MANHLGKWLSFVINGVFLILIRFYQLAISPLMANHCRFEPTCSRYAITALRLHGPWRGLILAVRRVLRCRPGVVGGVDPVPRDFSCSCRKMHTD